MALGLLAVVGLARLGLSLAGLPNSTVTWLSMTVVGWGAIVYYGVVPSLLGWGVGSLVLLITKKVWRRPSLA